MSFLKQQVNGYKALKCVCGAFYASKEVDDYAAGHGIAFG